MKSDLTASFLAHRAKPKPAPELHGPPSPFHLGLYPTDGYLSNSETRREREHRLGQAEVEGYELRPLDKAWLIRLRTCTRRKWAKIDIRYHASAEFASQQIKMFVPGGRVGH